jgi:hypothetical protein
MGVVVQCADCRGKMGDEIFCGKDRLREVEEMSGVYAHLSEVPGFCDGDRTLCPLSSRMAHDGGGNAAQVS